MEYRISFNKKYSYALITYSGNADFTGFINAIRNLYSDPSWEKDMDIVVEATNLDFSTVGTLDIVSIKDFVESNIDKMGKGRLAYVVKDDLGYGYSRAYEVSGGAFIHSEILIFDDLLDAVEWIEKKGIYNKAV